MKNVKKKLLTMLAALCMMVMVCPLTALAYVDPAQTTEAETTEAETTEAETTPPETESQAEPVLEETTPGDNAFSIPGNGEVLDDITDDSSKEFFTITTANNNTYFLVIDRSSNTENVYMLSMIDEIDLKEFLTEEEESEGNSQGAVILEEPQETVSDAPTQTEEGEAEGENNLTGILTVVLITALIGAGAYFYFKIYKPQREEDDSESENMEMDDGLATVNEDSYDEDDEDE
ncbi:CD1107 family mobile element protein [Lacrimispora indolis]|uniref:CD1107 family mobile element protein n=1 Tax=Lacrimispora indolis TaxID=69825 RepID=UPI0004029D0C|nr:DUF4366 domain-containing protein [[Clostridium] methoxybenzovorans]